MKRARPITTALLLALIVLVQAAPAVADDIQIGVYSQKESRSHASAGGHITVSRHHRGHPARNTRPKPPAQPSKGGGGAGSGTTTGGATDTLPPAPTLPSGSPLLRDPSPVGSGSFWYTGGNGASCVYVPNGTPVCYSISQPAGPAGPATDPATVAATLAARLNLSPGRIQASPAQAGLTAAASWFWLDPAPSTRTLTITLAGETVTVTASPSVEWRFGDTTILTGGPGIPYRPGPPPASAITHAYQTRCLPGDHRRNPYVLASCGESGYLVDATVAWRISYAANGPLSQSGALPTRTTATGRSFPITEARAFLTGTPP